MYTNRLMCFQIDFTILTIDAAVHVRHRFEVPIAHVLGDEAAEGGNEAVMAGLATLFRTDRQSGLAFPTSITPFDCDVPEHANRESCVRQAEHDAGGGHRRSRRNRRLQMAPIPKPSSLTSAAQFSSAVNAPGIQGNGFELSNPVCSSTILPPWEVIRR